MIALPENPTGADLVEAITLHAQSLDLPAHKLFARLSAHPQTWKTQTAIASRPKAHTIARVRALLSGEPIPPPPSNNFQQPNGRKGLGGKSAEEEVQKRLDAGQTSRRIFEDTGIHPSVIATVASRSSEAGTIAMNADLRSGSAKLRAAIFAESTAKEERRLAAQAWSSASALDSAADAAVQIFAPRDADARPPAFSREACGRCGARGDIGCRHQRPYDSQDIAL